MSERRAHAERLPGKRVAAFHTLMHGRAVLEWLMLAGCARWVCHGLGVLAGCSICAICMLLHCRLCVAALQAVLLCQ